MNRFRLILLSCALLFVYVTETAFANTKNSQQVEKFMLKMIEEHSFDPEFLHKLFSQGVIDQRVLEAIKRPSTSKPWYQFKKLFISSNRVSKGREWWIKHHEILQEAEEIYGVPAEIIVSIIGIETIYGTRMGSLEVFNSLYTLGFHTKRRSKFFKSELKNFLILCRSNKLNYLKVKGSFAGALGMPQFMPSSYRSYAVDFDDDGAIDLWNSIPDVVGSVANYLKMHGWKKSGNIVSRVRFKNKDAFELTKSGIKPSFSVGEIAKRGVLIEENIARSDRAGVFFLEGEGKRQYWISFKNFYVITRYNRSLNYAMAVYQLSEKIKRDFKTKK